MPLSVADVRGLMGPVGAEAEEGLGELLQRMARIKEREACQEAQVRAARARVKFVRGLASRVRAQAPPLGEEELRERLAKQHLDQGSRSRPSCRRAVPGGLPRIAEAAATPPGGQEDVTPAPAPAPVKTGAEARQRHGRQRNAEETHTPRKPHEQPRLPRRPLVAAPASVVLRPYNPRMSKSLVQYVEKRLESRRNAPPAATAVQRLARSMASAVDSVLAKLSKETKSRKH